MHCYLLSGQCEEQIEHQIDRDSFQKNPDSNLRFRGDHSVLKTDKHKFIPRSGSPQSVCGLESIEKGHKASVQRFKNVNPSIF